MDQGSSRDVDIERVELLTRNDVSGGDKPDGMESINKRDGDPGKVTEGGEDAEIDSLALFSAVSCDISRSSSPVKKVQFEVGDGEDGEEELIDINVCTDEKQPLPAISLNLQSSTESPITSPSRVGRGEARDYTTQTSSSISLLPVIDEESKHGCPPPIGIFSPPTNLRNPNMAIESLKSFISSTTGPNNGFYDAQLERPQENLGFVQLDILTSGGGDPTDISSKEWKQTSRWIKFEEDLEEGADRWSLPHVAFMTFHSLINLRRTIEDDALLLLDIEERDMAGISYRVVEEFAAKKLLHTEDCSLLMRLLMLRHRHVQESEKSWFTLRKNASSSVSLQSLYDEKSRARSGVFPMDNSAAIVRRNSALQKDSSPIKILHRTASGNYLKQNGGGGGSEQNVQINIGSMADNLGDEEFKLTNRKEQILRLLPSGAEATLVMVGEFEKIAKKTFAFVRLSEPAMMTVLEVPVPIRFVAILLVPCEIESEHIEMGRSFGTLMSNRNFFDISLNATSRKSLLNGINYFLDETIVLPPSTWNNHDLLSIHVLKAKSKSIRLRRMKKEQYSSFLTSRESVNVDGGGIQLQRMDSKTSDKGDDPTDPFHRTGRPFGGLINDIRRRYPFYKSDITDAFNLQCVATIIFMFFASIAHTVTFGGLMGEKTNNMIGVSETLISTSLSGILFSLISAQPLIPIGPTAPLLVFDQLSYQFCVRHDIEFLSARIWIGLWLMIITLVLTCFEGSTLVKLFTRFTQEIFAVLTSILLIYESVDNLVEIFEQHPLSAEHLPGSIPLTINNTNYSLIFEEMTNSAVVIDETEELSSQPNTALLCTILMLGTFFLAYFLREFRYSVFLGERWRRLLGDFSIPISIGVAVILDYVITDTYTQKMKVPEGLQPSNPDERGWIIHPMGEKSDVKLWVIFGSALPALLLFILMFMTTQICELIINTKERKMKKGSGLHLDLVIVSLINVANSFLGAPWLCCATLRGIAHVTALTVYSQNNPPGEKPSIVEVKEQRVTSFAVALLIGCSVLMGPFLKFIPLAVLFGVFLYLGVSSLSTTQLYDRVRLLFIPVSNHPTVPYVRRVRTWKMHAYTMIQLGALAVLWVVKSTKEAGLAFPFFLICMVPLRKQLKRFFTEGELEALDGDPSKK